MRQKEEIMKIEKDFILREIAGDYVIVPTGKTALEFNGLITVNELGAFIWEKLQQETTEEVWKQFMTLEKAEGSV